MHNVALGYIFLRVIRPSPVSIIPTTIHTHLQLNTTVSEGQEIPEGIPTLAQCRGLCVHMIPRAMLAVAYATGRATHDRQVKGDDLQVGGWA